ncbi:uncharacterized protein FFUJ_05099 [Fusarium fujikuroi IMI 58289]|uniref:RRM domain-containing protein n=1 Tax=Gibberella fujikuroi (strain CBS 195.34 / IMI 58289 / NRRL A-6831) TaxID=1279085 RepID=S0DM87_GIBF5|nr:uncharacterized protein FFUJ_05099 [Fusarium fujikuroi IMI 58289]CCT63744.1 uncharacterized protein FFUJ_05099 [Fusarium fujikuroi IMI 58289]SCN98606.1 uncharacterized protein FFM5_06903 [Fusarium fujikuroi]SCO38704.1 uncharacterized protein FFMR_05321 [Fusarium fujikuroi]
MALPTMNGDQGPTSEQGSWDLLSSRSDELSSGSYDFNGVGTAFGDLDSRPSDMSLALSANSDEVSLRFEEQDYLIKSKLASVETQLDYMSDTANFPNLSAEEIMSQREAREQARADLVRLKEENRLNRIRYDELRDEIIGSTDGNLTPTQVLAKMEELGRVEVDLLESNMALREMNQAQGDSSSRSDFARSDGNSAADGGNNDASPTNQGLASDDQDAPTSNQNETVSIRSDDEIYMININSVFDPDSPADSRRVLLEKIPQGTTLTQIANAVCGIGGLVRISLMHNLVNSGTAFKVACVEFRDSAAARKYVANVKANGLELVDGTGRFFEIEVKLINSTSSYDSRHGHPLEYGVGYHTEHSGRCITLENFPTSAIWHLLTRFGTKYIIRASFSPNDNQMNGKLSIEFASVFEAGRLCYMILNHVFLPYHGPASKMGFGPTPSDRDVVELTNSVSNTIAHVPPKHLSDAWNVQPFNLFTPSLNFAYGTPIPRRAVTSRTSSMNVEVVSRTPSMNIEVPHTPSTNAEASSRPSINVETLHRPSCYPGNYAVVPHILVRDDKNSPDLRDIQMTNITFNFVDGNTKYIIVKGKIFSRQVNGDIYTKLDDTELMKLKQDNVLKTNWAPFWRHYCEANEMPYLPKYAEYGRVASVRRNINKKFGFASSWNPERLTAIPNQIKAYLNPKSRKVVSTAEAEQK